MIPPIMDTSRLTWMSVVLLCGFAGCVGHGRTELLEGELRQQEDRASALERQLAETQTELKGARNEADLLRRQMSEKGLGPLLPEQANLLLKAVSVRFVPLQTSGVDRDDQVGHELLSVMLAPHDAEGGIVKLPGAVEFQVVDLAEPEGRQKLGTWSYSVEQTQPQWQGGLFATGYLFEVPWKQPPRHEDLTLHAKFTTPDGRAFTATQQIKVHPPREARTADTRKPQGPLLRSTSMKPAQPQQPAELRNPFGGDTNDAAEERLPEGGVQTSDRFRERDLPRYR
jgi:hypothetical protein